MSADTARGPLSKLVGEGTFFEDFEVGQRIRHARGSTIDEVENQYLSKLVVNTAAAHFDEAAMGSVGGRLVFGLVTGSIVIGLATQDTAECALRELSLTGLRFTAPVHHGDTVYAFTEVLATEPSQEHPDAGIVEFQHWGANQDDTVVFECKRRTLIKRRAVWERR
jgi:acyl dehydratase